MLHKSYLYFPLCVFPVLPAAHRPLPLLHIAPSHRGPPLHRGFVPWTPEGAVWICIDSHCVFRLRLSGETPQPLSLKMVLYPFNLLMSLIALYTFRYYLVKLFSLAYFFLPTTRRSVPWRQNSSHLHSAAQCLANGSHSKSRSLKLAFVSCSASLLKW